jgi:adenylate cyclase
VPARWKLNPQRTGGLIGAFITAALGFVLVNINLPVCKFLLHLSYDLPFIARPSQVPDEVMMIYLNDEAHLAFGPERAPYTGPWDRNIHATLVERLTAGGARAAVFDIVFSGPSADGAADAHFARALQANGRVILAGDYVPAAFGGAGGMKYVKPYAPFVTAAAGIGVTQFKPDADFEVRKHYHGSMISEPPLLSESWAAAKLVGVPIAQNHEARATERWINYYGPPVFLRAIAIHQAIDPALDPLVFSNKVVFVGAYVFTQFSGQRKDEFRNPWTAVTKGGDGPAADVMSFMPGAEVHATQFLNLLRGDWLTRSSGLAELLGALLVGLGCGYGFTQLRPLRTALAALAAILAVMGLAWLSFNQWHFWFPWLIVVVQIFVAMNYAIIFNSIQLYVQKKLFEQTLSLYVSPKLVKRLAADPEKARRFLKPDSAEKQTLTIVFTDIADFTSISERMDSNDLAIQMNRYFQQAVTHCVHSNDGTVVKYIGDAIFAFWNAPEAQAEHALLACRAALSFRDQPPQYMNGRLLVTRIGLHTGEANVGNFGSTQRVDYTALGENINLAARMEGLNKYLGTRMLATGETLLGARGQIVTRFCGFFRLKGFERLVEVHELVDRIENAEESRTWREAFAVALELFRAKNFADAEAAFRRVIDLRPDDGPSKFYLQRIEELRHTPPSDGWKGDVELKEK